MYTKPLSRYNPKTRLCAVDTESVLEVEPYIYNGRNTGRFHVKGTPPVQPYQGPLWKENQLFATREDAIAQAEAETSKQNGRFMQRQQEKVTCFECGCQATRAEARRTGWEYNEILGDWHCGC